MSIRRPIITTGIKKYNVHSTKNRIDDLENDILNNKEKIEEMPKLKVDYKNSNYFYNDVDCFREYPYKKRDLYYNPNESKRKYNIESNSSHITVENEDGYIKYIPNKNYNNYNYNDIPAQKNNNYIEISSHKNEYYDDNSEYSEGEGEPGDNDNDNDNDNMYYDNEEYENGMINNGASSPAGYKYNQYQENINFYLAPKKKNQNIINKAISNEIQFSSDNNLQLRPIKKNIRNCGNNTTTTNNTFNNNIYYINPINLKNKTKENNNSNNKIKKYNSNNNNVVNPRNNIIYKSVDNAVPKKRMNRERDFFKINNIDKSKREFYLKSIILIQSIFRGYLVKIKLYNNINLYVCCKNGIDLLEEYLLKAKKEFWIIFKNSITNMMKCSNFSIRSKYKLKNNKKKENLVNQYHKELGDSFNIINKDNNKENNEKLKSKLDVIMKENSELKNQIIDNKNLESKLKSLLDENKKNQNINAIIMKDNQQLAKKLKDIQDYRNNKLLIENQYSYDLNKIIIQELNDNNEMHINKLKKVLLYKLLHKKLNDVNNVMKEKINIYKNNVHKLNDKEKENSLKKENCVKNLIKIYDKHIKLLLKKYFLNLYFKGLFLEKEKKMKEDNKKLILKKMIYIFEKKNIMFLNNMKFKLFNNIKYYEFELKEEQRIKQREQMLLKLFIKYEKNVRIIYKEIMEKWNLRAKIIGIRTAARDKKKKRKQKKKNNRILYNQKYATSKNNYGPKLCKSIHEFSYIVSNGAIIKESSSNEQGRMVTGNKSSKNININTSPNNNIDTQELKKSKNKSVTKRNVYKIKKDSIDNNKDNSKDNNIDYNKTKDNVNNEESDEDSGESFGLDNNSD